MSSGRRPVSIPIWVAALTSAGSQGAQVGAQDRHDLRRQVPAGLAVLRVGRDVTAFDGEVPGQPGRRLAGAGQAQGADPGQHRPHVPADHVAAVTADLAGGLQVGDPVEEVLQVAASQRRRVAAAVRAGMQVTATAARRC